MAKTKTTKRQNDKPWAVRRSGRTPSPSTSRSRNYPSHISNQSSLLEYSFGPRENSSTSSSTPKPKKFNATSKKKADSAAKRHSPLKLNKSKGAKLKQPKAPPTKNKHKGMTIWMMFKKLRIVLFNYFQCWVNFIGLFHSLFWIKLKWSVGVKRLSHFIELSWSYRIFFCEYMLYVIKRGFIHLCYSFAYFESLTQDWFNDFLLHAYEMYLHRNQAEEFQCQTNSRLGFVGQAHKGLYNWNYQQKCKVCLHSSSCFVSTFFQLHSLKAISRLTKFIVKQQ